MRLIGLNEVDLGKHLLLGVDIACGVWENLVAEGYFLRHLVFIPIRFQSTLFTVHDLVPDDVIALFLLV